MKAPWARSERRALLARVGPHRVGDAASREDALEEVSDVLLLTDNDNFNALAAFELRQELGNAHVFRLSPREEVLDVVPAYAEGGVLFGREYTYPELSRRFAAGARLSTDADGHEPLLVVTEDRELRVTTRKAPVHATPRDTAIALVDADNGGTRPAGAQSRP
jgi:hypothetical protein